jgi:dihydroorotate dehydrogenase
VIADLCELAWRPAAAIIRRTDPATAHARTVSLMRYGDAVPGFTSGARLVRDAVLAPEPVRVGRVDLPSPLIVAAGLVKGDGFAREEDALAAVRAGQDIVPGWRSTPALAGPVEFGSYTWHPRLGNRGRVLWRDFEAGWMQNRIGLRNPGARAAAAFLAGHAADLPDVWGLSLSVSPGVSAPGQSRDEVVRAAEAFATAFAGTEAGPAWVTLNLSCPNTEDDPQGNQSADLARALCSGLLEATGAPLWVKIGPDLADEQLAALVSVFGEVGVRAVVATNTLAAPDPDGTGMAGVSGSRLRPLTLDTVTRLKRAIDVSTVPLDIVASGGILIGADLRAVREAGAVAGMIYTALVLRGPLAAALILREAARGRQP